MNRGAGGEAAIGLAAAITTYIVWGLSPLYWHLLAHVDVLDILAHRYIWALPLTVLGVAIAGSWHKVRAVLVQPRMLAVLTLTAGFVTINSGVYVWAVNNGQVVEASLGYFLTPLLNTLFGMVIFAERLRPWQWVALGLAAAGVANKVLMLGAVPWIGLALGTSFALYGALRKRIDVGTLTGYFVEMAILAPPALVYAIWLGVQGAGAFGAVGIGTDLLLVGGGIMTAVPFLLYVTGARRLPLSTMAIFFYINPTLQFLVGIWFFDEPVTAAQLFSFVLIWLALAIYTIEGRLRMRRRAAMI
jgi:chloramphenicol-sensitive protein RarD